MQVTITLSTEAAQGFTDAGIDPAPVIEQRANEIGKAHAHSAKLRSRKELVQEIESSGDIDATYAVVTAMRNSATYHNALIDTLIADAIEHSTLVGTVISRGKPVTHNGITYICTREHTAQSDWTPDVAITLFSALPVVDEQTGYEVWKAWDGHNDSLYQEGAIVWYPAIDTTLYIATLGNNHWQPDSGTGWQVYVPA